MRYRILLAAIAMAVVACSDRILAPTRHAGGHLTDSLSTTVLSAAIDSTVFDTTVVYTDSVFAVDTATVIVPADTVTSVYPISPITQLTALACSNSHTRAARARISPAGGTVGAGGVTVVIPAGAIPDSTVFEVIVPVSPVLRADIHALAPDGTTLASYQFQLPVKVTFNMSRCGALPQRSLQSGYVVEQNLRQILQVGGADRANSKYTFSTPHLSGYVIYY
jgi:hypothetical protein